MKLRAVLFAIALALLLLSCGGGSGTTHPSRVKTRVFVSNTFAGALDIIDVTKDQLRAQIPSGSGFLGVTPQFFVLSPDKGTSAVFDFGTNSVSIVNNKDESITGSINLPSWTESIVLSGDNKTGWAAVRNAVVANQPATGAIEVMDVVNGGISKTINIPLVRTLALNHAGTKLLAFSDQSNAVSIVDLATLAVTAVPGFDRPVTAIFSDDDSKAYVLSCGAECVGGTAANVRVLDMTTSTPGASVAVSGATVGLLNGGNLYVAGTAPAGSAAPGGFLNIVSVATMTLVNAAPIQIGDGHHGVIAFSTNGKLYVGARGCTNDQTNVSDTNFTGCLSIFTPGDTKAVVPVPNCGRDPNASALTCGDVTGIQPITGRDVVYIIQGGELVMYNSATNTLQGTQVDISGKCFDVKQVD